MAKSKKILVSVHFRGRSKWALVAAVWEKGQAYIDHKILDDMAASLGVKSGQTYIIG